MPGLRHLYQFVCLYTYVFYVLCVCQLAISCCDVCLQVTHSVLVTPEVQARIGGAASSSQATTPFRAAVQQLLMFFAETYQRVFKFEHPPLHDPCAVAFVIAPELFQVGVMYKCLFVCNTIPMCAVGF